VKWLKRISKNIGIYPKNVVISVIRGVGLISNIQKENLVESSGSHLWLFGKGQLKRDIPTQRTSGI